MESAPEDNPLEARVRRRVQGSPRVREGAALDAELFGPPPTPSELGVGERSITLMPHGRGGSPRARGLRVIGPGRRERDYLERVDDLTGALDQAHRELDHAALIERGTGRFVERMVRESRTAMERLEGERQESLQREEALRRQLNRTLVLLGATQNEVEGLRQALAGAARRALASNANTGWLARLTGRLFR